VSRTGYTGEDGFEVIVYGASVEHPEGAIQVWEKLASTSTPCGLSARDSLRLEAGFPLHGSDIDQNTNPFQAELSWVISAGKTGFVGSNAIAAASTQHPQSIRRGLVLEIGIPRHGFEIEGGSGPVGTVTSGGFSPIIRKGIALCRLSYDSSEFGTKVSVNVRDTQQGATITKPPFYDERLYGWKRQKDN
jgi:aminomethyltransferase